MASESKMIRAVIVILLTSSTLARASEQLNRRIQLDDALRGTYHCDKGNGDRVDRRTRSLNERSQDRTLSSHEVIGDPDSASRSATRTDETSSGVSKCSSCSLPVSADIFYDKHSLASCLAAKCASQQPVANGGSLQSLDNVFIVSEDRDLTTPVKILNELAPKAEDKGKSLKPEGRSTSTRSTDLGKFTGSEPFHPVTWDEVVALIKELLGISQESLQPKEHPKEELPINARKASESEESAKTLPINNEEVKSMVEKLHTALFEPADSEKSLKTGENTKDILSEELNKLIASTGLTGKLRTMTKRQHTDFSKEDTYEIPYLDESNKMSCQNEAIKYGYSTIAGIVAHTFICKLKNMYSHVLTFISALKADLSILVKLKIRNNEALLKDPLPYILKLKDILLNDPERIIMVLDMVKGSASYLHMISIIEKLKTFSRGFLHIIKDVLAELKRNRHFDLAEIFSKRLYELLETPDDDEESAETLALKPGFIDTLKEIVYTLHSVINCYLASEFPERLKSTRIGQLISQIISIIRQHRLPTLSDPNVPSSLEPNQVLITTPSQETKGIEDTITESDRPDDLQPMTPVPVNTIAHSPVSWHSYTPVSPSPSAATPLYMYTSPTVPYWKNEDNYNPEVSETPENTVSSASSVDKGSKGIPIITEFDDAPLITQTDTSTTISPHMEVVEPGVSTTATTPLNEERTEYSVTTEDGLYPHISPTINSRPNDVFPSISTTQTTHLNEHGEFPLISEVEDVLSESDPRDSSTVPQMHSTFSITPPTTTPLSHLDTPEETSITEIKNEALEPQTHSSSTSFGIENNESEVTPTMSSTIELTVQAGIPVTTEDDAINQPHVLPTVEPTIDNTLSGTTSTIETPHTIEPSGNPLISEFVDIPSEPHSFDQSTTVPQTDSTLSRISPTTASPSFLAELEEVPITEVKNVPLEPHLLPSSTKPPEFGIIEPQVSTTELFASTDSPVAKEDEHLIDQSYHRVLSTIQPGIDNNLFETNSRTQTTYPSGPAEFPLISELGDTHPESHSSDQSTTVPQTDSTLSRTSPTTTSPSFPTSPLKVPLITEVEQPPHQTQSHPAPTMLSHMRNVLSRLASAIELSSETQEISPEPRTLFLSKMRQRMNNLMSRMPSTEPTIPHIHRYKGYDVSIDDREHVGHTFRKYPYQSSYDPHNHQASDTAYPTSSAVIPHEDPSTASAIAKCISPGHVNPPFALSRDKIAASIGRDLLKPGDVIVLRLHDKMTVYGKVHDRVSPISFNLLKPNDSSLIIRNGGTIWNFIANDFHDPECEPTTGSAQLAEKT